MRRVSDSMLLSLRRGGSPFQWATRKLPVVPVAVYPTPRHARSVSARRLRTDSPWLTPEILSAVSDGRSATTKRAVNLISPPSTLTRGPHGKRHDEARFSTTMGVSSRPKPVSAVVLSNGRLPLPWRRTRKRRLQALSRQTNQPESAVVAAALHARLSATGRTRLVRAARPRPAA